MKAKEKEIGTLFGYPIIKSKELTPPDNEIIVESITPLIASHVKSILKRKKAKTWMKKKSNP